MKEMKRHQTDLNSIVRNDHLFWIEKAIREVMIRKRLLNYEKFWLEICNKFNVSERKAKEYIKIAKSKITEKEWNEWARP